MLCRPLRGLGGFPQLSPGSRRGLVRLKARVVREVKVLLRHTLSGLKPKVTASWQHGVGSNRR
jgi:hypothetical protein